MLNEGQRRELEVWAREVLPRAVVYARSLTRESDNAEDVVQECLFRLLRRADDYDLVRDGIKLLFRAISNLCINQLTRRRSLADLDRAGPEGGPLQIEDRLAVMPEDALAGKEMQAVIDASLARLPPMQRAALELCALGQTKAQIAEILQVGESNAGVLVHRARHALALALGPLIEPEKS